jgi:type I restriction enzyme, S subunit
MSSEYRVLQLGAVASVRSGYAFKSSDMGSEGHPLIKIANIAPPRVHLDSCDRISKEVISRTPNADRYLLRKGDILIAMTGATAGKTGRFPSTSEDCYLNQRVGKVYVTDNNNIDEEYLYQVLSRREFADEILSLADGSAQGNISGSLIETYKFSIPPLIIQKGIARILGTLDDKIELNRKINATLEAMAKALFKSWFVDFDPVRAKAEGRPTGLPADISDQFPDSFEDSELGEIPSGWRVVELGTLYTIGKGGIWGDDTCSGEEFTEVSCLRGIDCHNLASGSIPLVPSRWVKRSQIESRIPEDGAILVEGSGSFCGRSLLWEEKYLQLFERPVVYSNFCKRLTPTCSKVYAPVAWMALRGCYDSNEVANFRTGTAFPNLDTSGLLKGVSIVLPSEGVAKAFQDSHYLRNRVDLMAQSILLENIKDALHPKLISGEIRISDAEKMLEEVGV